MNLKVCSNFHFIRAIKDGVVQAVQNVDSRGRPGLKFRKLEDILGIADGEFPCQHPIDRSTRQRATETTDFCYDGVDDEKNIEPDELLGEMTLKQLKKKCRTKKRKASEPVVLIPKEEPCELEPNDDDDMDLKQPLIILKSKLLKSQNSKKKRASKKIFAPNEIALSCNTEQTTDAGVALQANDDLCAIITVKVECQEAEYWDCQNMNAVSESPISEEQDGFSGVTYGNNSETDTGMEPVCATNEVSYDHLEHNEPIIYLPWSGWEHTELGHQEMVGQQSPVLHVKDLTREGDVNTQPPSLCSETLSTGKNQCPSMCSSSDTCPDKQQFVPVVESYDGIEVSEVTADSGLCCMEIGRLDNSCMDEDNDMEDLPVNQENISLNTPVENVCSTWISHSCSSPVNKLTSVEDHSPNTVEKPLVASSSANTELDFDNNNSTILENAFAKHEEKQTLVPDTMNAEREVSIHSYPHDNVTKCSSSEIKNYQYSEWQQPPERFPSTRKVISPTSQEKLCLAMKTCESVDDISLYECKEKLFFEKEDVEKASLAGSDNKSSVEASINPKGPEKVIRAKFTINPKQILKKHKNEKRPSPPRKGSAPKGCLEGPRLCRSLPNLSTGCTSVQVCSESAIAFSQRQMHDIESLALKLMTELKTMKDIVEEKVLYESYLSASLKNDADEVKVAIKTATKTEETAKKWLSMMSRDCTRFCKIMKLTDNDTPSTENTIQCNTPQKEKKKISFADEAGGMLCDVKFFDDGLASKASRSEQ